MVGVDERVWVASTTRIVVFVYGGDVVVPVVIAVSGGNVDAAVVGVGIVVSTLAAYYYGGP